MNGEREQPLDASCGHGDNPAMRAYHLENLSHDVVHGYIPFCATADMGEWHTQHPAPLTVRKEIVDFYLRAFRKTPLVFMSDDAEVLNYALAHGTGFRRDGVGSPWHEQNWIAVEEVHRRCRHGGDLEACPDRL